MNCEICRGELNHTNYKEILPFINIQAHSSEEWEVCKKNMLDNNMTTFFSFYGKYNHIINGFPTEYKELENLIVAGNSFELVLNIDNLGEMLNQVFKDTVPTISNHFIPKLVKLDRHIYEKLLAYELENSNSQSPEQLKFVTGTILDRLQHGEFDLDSPHSYGAIPNSRSEQYIMIPSEFSLILMQSWVNKDRGMERLLFELSNTISVRNRSLVAASSFTNFKISSINASKRADRSKSVAISYALHDRIQAMKNKRNVLERVLRKNVNPNKLLKEINNLTFNGHSTVRIDKNYKYLIDRYSEDTGLPKYKVVTGLLLLGKDLTSY